MKANTARITSAERLRKYRYNILVVLAITLITSTQFILSTIGTAR